MTHKLLQKHFVFLYGTLKRNFPNANHLRKYQSEFVGSAETCHPMPLVVGPYGIPFLIDEQGNERAFHVKGELHSVSNAALSFLDSFEGVQHNFYERIQVDVKLDDADGTVTAWTYVRYSGNGDKSSFSGQNIWSEWTAKRLSEETTISEYTVDHARTYLARELEKDVTGTVTHKPS